MIIDIHNHTSRYSSCSKISPDELIKAYIKADIDGICITEHNYLWPEREQLKLLRKYQGLIKIFFGIELSTDLGHILVFGHNIAKLELIYRIEELEKSVNRDNCALIWAHPFRWGMKKGFKITMDLLKKFDALELYNGCLNDKQIKKTAKILNKFDINYTGASDTHSFEMTAKYATSFEDNINDVDELVKNIKYKKYYPIVL